MSSDPTSSIVQTNSQNTTASISDGLHQTEPDAEQQLIFVTDLDAWCVNALIGTASYRQLPHLQAVLYRHLAFEPYFGFETTVEGLRMFQLAFHLPYHALRSSKKPRIDSRRYADGDPLRHVHDVSFLDFTDSETSSFLYEAQISCMISGPDEWRWVVYCFVDTYFDPESERESILSDPMDNLLAQGLRLDPFTRDYYAANDETPTHNPREFFLTMLRFRIDQVKNEWTKVVERLKKSIREYERSFLSVSGEDSSSKSRNFVTQVKWLSKKLFLDLSETVSLCEEFCLEPVLDLQSGSESSDNCPLLIPIKSTLKELKSLEKKLESVAKNWEDFTRDLEVRLNLETIQVARLSVTMMLFISPIGLSTGIFSMNQDVISFIPASFGSFVCTIMVFGAMGGFIHFAEPEWFWRHLCDIASIGHLYWTTKITAPTYRLPQLRRHHSLQSPKIVQKDEEDVGTDPTMIQNHEEVRETRSLGTIALKPGRKTLSGDLHSKSGILGITSGRY
jgi:hypothetical protein